MRRGASPCAATVGLELGGAQCRRQGAGLAGLAGQQEHARRAADGAVGFGGVVLGPRVARHLQPHHVAVEAGLAGRQRERELLLAAGELHGLTGKDCAARPADGELADRGGVAVEVDDHAATAGRHAPPQAGRCR